MEYFRKPIEDKNVSNVVRKPQLIVFHSIVPIQILSFNWFADSIRFLNVSRSEKKVRQVERDTLVFLRIEKNHWDFSSDAPQTNGNKLRTIYMNLRVN